MPKIRKMYWTTSKGERKLNCYEVTISKEVVCKTNITPNDELLVSAKDNKIIIEKKQQ